MNKPNKKMILSGVVVLAVVVLAVFTYFVVATPTVFAEGDTDYATARGWNIPPPVKQIQNPLQPTSENLRMGRVWYSQNCQSCHGGGGQGDGPSAPDLTADPGDFTSAEFQSLTDGELFFMTNEGKDEMPGFRGELTDHQIWQAILYIQTLE
ncbi:MAG: c-type cytochrome [Bradymonadaceae bacterium]